METQVNVFKNTLFLGACAAFSKIVSFLLMPLYTGCLPPESFGKAELIVSAAVLLLPLITLNAPEAIFRFSIGEEGKERVLGVGLCLWGTGFLILVMLLPFLRRIAVFSEYLGYLFFYLFFSGARSFFAHFLRADGAYTAFALQQLFCALLTIVFQLLFLPILSLGIKGYLLAILLADGVCAACLLLYLLSRHKLRVKRFDKQLFFSMLRYAMPLIPMAALWWSISYSDRYLLLRYASGEAVGIYSVAAKIPGLLSFVCGIFLEVWRYASICVSAEQSEAYFSRIYRVFLAFCAVCTGAIVLFGDLAVRFLFPSVYSSAAEHLPILSLAVFFSVLATFLGSVYAKQKASGAALLSAFSGALVHISMAIFLVPRSGASGAAYSLLGAWCFVYAFRAIGCKKHIPFDLRTKKTVVFALLVVVGMLAKRALLKAFFFAIIISSLLIFIPEMKEILPKIAKESEKILKKAKKSNFSIDKFEK